ncbi:MAG TPA: oxygenase MpaB family protein [Solirubrobacteraceae bacterium]|nr:oxygenase MpaB family protein [Solirubrobacteraceae bacterium]
MPVPPMAHRTGHDDGYFPAGRSPLRRVHAERLVGLFYGQRALCIGAVKPLNYVGTSEHSYAKLTPFRRLVKTGNAFETIYFGSRADADRVLRRVAGMHERVRGTLSEDAGATPAGTPYSAFDPALMLWTVAVIADSAQRFYELFVRRLAADEREGLWRDYVRFGELFGLAAADMPSCWGEFREYWQAELAAEDLFLTDEARYVGYSTAFEIPLPATHQPGKAVHDLIMLGSLPHRVRELYGLPYTTAQRTAFRAAVAGLHAARRVTPRALARGWNTRSFELVAATERRRVRRGEPTPQVTDTGPAPLPRRRGPVSRPRPAQATSRTTLPVAPRSSSSFSASDARSSG